MAVVQLPLEGPVLVGPDSHQPDGDPGAYGCADQRAAFVPGLVVAAMSLAAGHLQVLGEAACDVVAVAKVVGRVRQRLGEVQQVTAAGGMGLEARRERGGGRVHALPSAWPGRRPWHPQGRNSVEDSDPRAE